VPTLLAVYGTLRRGFRNEYLTHGRSEFVGEGRLPGRLLHIGGPLRSYPYPGYVPGPSGEVVVELLRITDAAIWADLHLLESYDPRDPEGSEYHPMTVTVRRLDGSTVPAWTYVFVQPYDGWPVIEDGDWASVSPVVGEVAGTAGADRPAGAPPSRTMDG
jgi:gamma-glutamylcyclotransferase (GGCT)/AIG2-like uncharacterized protein YtfP